MGEIFSSCNKGGCEWCHEDDIEYEGLIDALSEMHITGTRDPETLCQAGLFKDFKEDSPDFKEILKMQGKLFILACDHFLPWARNYR